MPARGEIDLHTHTNCSDGDLSPKELLDLAAQKGLVALAITDHDTVAAYSNDTYEHARALNVELVSGIELSTRGSDGGKYHVLGLLIDVGDAQLKFATNDIAAKRKETAGLICSKLNKTGWFVDQSGLLNKLTVVTKAHIAQSVLADPRNRVKLTSTFSGIPSVGQFIERFMIKGKACFVEQPDSITPQRAIELIHMTKGVAILAHPTFNILKGEDPQSLCDKFVQMGIDGFESIYIQYDRSRGDEPHDNREFLEQYSRDHDLVISGGSDFHTSTESMGKVIDLGFDNHEWSVPYSVLEQLKNRESPLHR